MGRLLPIAIVSLLLLMPGPGSARGRGGSVHVHGYRTSTGHYVAPYTRSAPHSSDRVTLPHEPHSSSRTSSLTSHPSTRAAVGVTRDSHGHIKRSETAKRDFEHHRPCPSTGKTSGACPGYVVDHIVPLKRGGADHPSHKQWQTPRPAEAKEPWEEA